MRGVGTPDAYQDFRLLELPTNSSRNSQPSSHLKTSHWALVYYTGHVRCDQAVNSPSQLSARRRNSWRLLELMTIGTPDSRRNSRWTDPRTPRILPWLGKYRTRPVSIPDRYCQTSKKQVSSFVSQTLKTHMGWHEHLWMIIYQHDASLLIVRHTY